MQIDVCCLNDRYPSHYESLKPAPADQVIAYIEENLMQSGTLQMTPEGFVYVDVDDDYIHQLVSFIQSDGFEEPPYFESGGVGAHISVISEKEFLGHGLGEIGEIGQQVEFRIKECQRVHPPQFKGVQEVYFVTVEAPALDQLRAAYGLPKGLYEFHITIGIKRDESKHLIALLYWE